MYVYLYLPYECLHLGMCIVDIRVSMCLHACYMSICIYAYMYVCKKHGYMCIYVCICTHLHKLAWSILCEFCT